MISTGAGMCSTWPVPSARKTAFESGDGPSVGEEERGPAATLIMPSVAMKGGRRPPLIRSPFTRPQAPPVTSASSRARGTGTPALSNKPRTMPDSARIEPTASQCPR